MFQGKPIMVRIKAKTMAAASYAAKSAQLDQCSNSYGFYFPPTAYQHSCPAHASTQQLFHSDVWTASGYQDCAGVSLLHQK